MKEKPEARGGRTRKGASPQPCATHFLSGRREPVLPRHCRHDPAVPALVQAAGAVLQGLLGDLHAGHAAGRPGVGFAVFLPPQLLWGESGQQWGVLPSLSSLLPSQFILLYIFMDLSGTTLHYGAYRFPRWGQALGVCMGVLSCIQIPLWAGIALCKESGTLVAVSWGEHSVGRGMGPASGKRTHCPGCVESPRPLASPEIPWCTSAWDFSWRSPRWRRWAVGHLAQRASLLSCRCSGSGKPSDL